MPDSHARTASPRARRAAGAAAARPLAAVLLLALAWRLVLAWQMPCIARDGVNFCTLAQRLDREGPSALRDESFEQHPLYPAALLGIVRLGAAVGADRGDPWVWQRAGQAVALLAGMAVVGLAAALAARIARRLEPGAPAGRAAVFAALLAALAPLNTGLSADVMSDPLHLAFYLAALLALIRPGRLGSLTGCGALAGLAFLTRPEGALPALVAPLVALRTTGLAWPRRILHGTAAPLAFAAVALPYAAYVGKLSPKLEKQGVEEFRAALPGGDPVVAAWQGAAPSGDPQRVDPPHRAALLRRETAWYEALPIALYETLRGGRFIAPLLALPLLWSQRRNLRDPALSGPLLCLLGHVGLAAWLIFHAGYLHPRHALVAGSILLIYAGVWLAQQTAPRGPARTPRPAGILALLAVATLAFYSLRIPNAGDAFLVRAAERIRATDPPAGALLLGGSNERRVSFYAGLRHQNWNENKPPAQRFQDLRNHLLHFQPAFLAVETGPGREVAGNDELLERLSADPALAARWRPLFSEPGPAGAALHVFRDETAASRPAADP
jgi:hypothetical protein